MSSVPIVPSNMREISRIEYPHLVVQIITSVNLLPLQHQNDLIMLMVMKTKKNIIRIVLRERFIEKKKEKTDKCLFCPYTYLRTVKTDIFLFFPLYVTRCVKIFADCWPFSLIFTQFGSFFFLNF